MISLLTFSKILPLKEAPLLIRHVTASSSRLGLLKRTLAQHADMPHLPVPALSSTLDKYLRFVQPLVTHEEFTRTKSIVENFFQDRGPILQERLVERSKQTKNWLSDWWLQVAYMDYRAPVVINVSPGIGLPMKQFATEDDWLGFSARLVCGIMDFKRIIDEDRLPHDRIGKDPLCMRQYYNVFGTCRIPGLQRDRIVFNRGAPPKGPRHIIVLHKNHIFSVDVQTESGDLISEGDIFQQLKQVVAKSQNEALPIGLLTTENRTTWAKSYERLRSDPHNEKSFDTIHKAIFALCLDQPVLKNDKPEKVPSIVTMNMLHGGGPETNSSNRWFDKTCQLIVSRDGACGLAYEHSPAEGPPVITFVDHAYEYINRLGNKPIETASGASLPPVTEMTFNIDEATKQDFEVAKTNIRSLISNLQLTAFTLTTFGKNFAKQHQLSPDAFIQMAIQLTYRRLHNVPCATYESGSTRRFALGRTDTIRSCGPISVAFTSAMDNKKFLLKQRAQALKTAIKEHTRHTMEVLNGEGIDRHLLGLKLIALEHGENVPDIFEDSSYKKALHFNVSTSQVPAKVDGTMCFGPVVSDGYGLCYNPQKDRVHFTVTANNSCPDTDSDTFAKELKRSFGDMQDVLDQSTKKTRP